MNALATLRSDYSHYRVNALATLRSDYSHYRVNALAPLGGAVQDILAMLE